MSHPQPATRKTHAAATPSAAAASGPVVPAGQLAGTRARLLAAVPDRRPLAMLVLAQLITGLAIGLIWLAWAPTSLSYMFDTGGGAGVAVPAESEAQVAGDGRYAMLTVLAGLLFGLLAWRLRGNRGPAMLVALGLSSLLSSLLAVASGQLLSSGQRGAPINTAFHPPVVLHAGAAVFLQALLAVLTYTVFVGLSGDQELGRGAGQQPGSDAADMPAPGLPDQPTPDFAREPRLEPPREPVPERERDPRG